MSLPAPQEIGIEKQRDYGEGFSLLRELIRERVGYPINKCFEPAIQVDFKL